MLTRLLTTIALAFTLFASVAGASVIYLTDGDNSVLYRVDLEAGTFSSFPTYSLAYPIAVADTVRLGHRDNGSGAEYDLDGNPTGTQWGGGAFISQILDGTTDGVSHNYGVTCCDEQAVYRFDRLWGNAEFMFSLGDVTGGRGIAYDPVNDTLWVMQFNGSLVQHSLDGSVVSSTAALTGINLVGLSFDPASNSFWAYNRGNTFYNFDRSGTVLGTVVIAGLASSNVYGGEIPMDAVAAAYTVGGSIANLEGEGLELHLAFGDSGSEDLSPDAGDTDFTFASAVPDGSTYEVTVTAQPSNPPQTCTVPDGGGVIDGADETDIAVVCATNTYTLTYTAGENGWIDGLSPQTVEHGDSGSAVEAVPDEGYHFVSWSDGSTVNPRTDADVTADISVAASFGINQYQVTASVAGEHGAIAPDSLTVEHGNTAGFTVTPDPGYHAVQPFSGDCATGTLAGSIYTTGAVTGDCSVIASFAQNTAAGVSAQSGGGQSAPVYESFASPLVVRVTDADGVPLEGILVTFTSPASGASVDFAASAEAVFAVATDADGLAGVAATANAIAGGYEVTAAVEGVAVPATFALTNEALIPTLTLSADPQNVPHGAPVTLTLLVAGVNPTGTVDFVLGTGTVLCEAVPLAEGVATCTYAGPLPPGQNTVTALYGGDGSHAPAQAAVTLGVQSPAITVPTASPWALGLLALALGFAGMRRRG